MPVAKVELAASLHDRQRQDSIRLLESWLEKYRSGEYTGQCVIVDINETYDSLYYNWQRSSNTLYSQTIAALSYVHSELLQEVGE